MSKKSSKSKKLPPLGPGDITLIVGLIVVVLAVIGGVIGWEFSRPTNKTVTPESFGIDIEDQPSSSVQLSNRDSQSSMTITLQIFQGDELWSKVEGTGSLGPAIYNDFTKNPPNYQLVTLQPKEYMVLKMPDTMSPWRISPQTYNNDQTFITLVECNRDYVCNMSVVNGMNYYAYMQLTVAEGISTIDLNTAPCEGKGPCTNAKIGQEVIIDGIFAEGKTAASAPCPYGTCNLIDDSKRYCDAVHTTQCANSSSTWSDFQRASTCETTPPSFTTYCYSHDDRNSSPVLAAPYKLKIVYAHLV